MATLTLILTLLVLLPVVTRIYLLNPNNALHLSVVVTGIFLIFLGILEYEIANNTSLENMKIYAQWHTIISIILLYTSSLIGYYFAAPHSEKWKKIGLIIAFILPIPAIFIIYKMLNGAILDTNHQIINGQWQYEINKKSFTGQIFQIWSFIIIIYLSISHFVAFYLAKKGLEKLLKFLLFLTFTIIPFLVVYQFIFSIDVENTGTYNITPYITVILIVISWIYTNFKLFEINPIAAVDNILESMSNIIIITDNDFKTKYVNDIVRTFGVHKKDLLNKSIIDFVQTVSKIPAKNFIKLKNLKKDEKLIETFTFNFNQNDFHLLTTASAAYNQQNLKIGYVFVLINLTETIQNRNQLKAYSLQLEQSNKELERFAYIASHDMKAPLRNIISFLGLIERKLKKHEDNDIHEFIYFASSNARYMHSLVQDILEYSKISKINEVLESVDLNETLKAIKNDFSKYISERNAIVNFEELPVINANKSQIYQLFQNIIENGIKYNESDIPTVNITVKQENKRLKIAFEDNGIGISEEFHQQIFEMFKRLHNNTVYEGTGIGLAICKKIMELHNGNIQVAVNEQKGTTFVLDFPMI